MPDAGRQMPDEDGSSAFLGVKESATGKIWHARDVDERLALALCQKFSVPDVLGRIMAARGIGLDNAASFLEPRLKDLMPNPSDFKDMEKSARRIADAVKAGEKIAIFGDYDVDGATSSALLKKFFAQLGVQPVIYIPDRLKEGYGPNVGAMEILAEQGVRIVITVDCGITAFEPLARAKELGLQVIVLDHHAAEPSLPEAYGVVNPNRLDESGEYGYLAAVGVTFLFIVALNRALREDGFYKQEPDLLGLLDLVALGTVCDVVPLIGLNRSFVVQGLKVMAGMKNLGIKALADVAGMDETPAAYHAGFVLGPRVNAGGRVGQADLGSRLLSTSDPREAAQIAGLLNEFNIERKRIEEDSLNDAFSQAETQVEGQGRRHMVFAAEKGWHPGVIGIMASRLKERYHRPALVVAVDDEGVGKGSGRSVKGVDLGAAIIAARQKGLLLNGGGHKMAAGFTVAADKMDELVDFLDDRIARQIKEQGDIKPSVTIDGLLSAGALSSDLYYQVHRLAPFGSANAEPCFALSNVRIVNSKIVGSDHVSCFFSSQDGKRFKGIAFRCADQPLGQALLHTMGPLHVVGTLHLNKWQGRENCEIIIRDLGHVA